MVDSWGDGWNGGSFDASIGGVNIGSGTITAGASGSFTFAVGAASCDVYGCTDPLADNYDASANIDDGSCCLDNFVSVETFMIAFNTPYLWEFNGLSWSVNAFGDTNIVASGDTLNGGTTLGSNADACLPDGCYEFVTTDLLGYGNLYDVGFILNGDTTLLPSGNLLFTLGSATCPILGCTDATALNYDAAADTDDGSCAYPCLDNEVPNYYD
jgi:hypothetical protein